MYSIINFVIYAHVYVTRAKRISVFAYLLCVLRPSGKTRVAHEASKCYSWTACILKIIKYLIYSEYIQAFLSL